VASTAAGCDLAEAGGRMGDDGTEKRQTREREGGREDGMRAMLRAIGCRADGGMEVVWWRRVRFGEEKVRRER